MKNTLTTYEVATELLADDNANWTRSGALALAEYLEQIEEDCGIEIELDVVALRCEYSEHESLIDYANDHFMSWQEEFGIEYENPLTGETDMQSTIDGDGNIHEAVFSNIEEYIRDNGTLIEFDGGIIVSNF
jgi:hypothetical protein